MSCSDGEADPLITGCEVWCAPECRCHDPALGKAAKGESSNSCLRRLPAAASRRRGMGAVAEGNGDGGGREWERCSWGMEASAAAPALPALGLSGRVGGGHAKKHTTAV